MEKRTMFGYTTKLRDFKISSDIPKLDKIMGEGHKSY